MMNRHVPSLRKGWKLLNKYKNRKEMILDYKKYRIEYLLIQRKAGKLGDKYPYEIWKKIRN